jgi:DNA-directed RNA polymerase subunit N (RpoN/RPB10)
MYNYQVQSNSQFPVNTAQGFTGNQLPSILPRFNTNILPSFSTQPGFMTNQLSSQPQPNFPSNQLPSFNSNVLPPISQYQGVSQSQQTFPTISQYQPVVQSGFPNALPPVVQSGFPNALPPVVQTGFGMMQQLSSSPVVQSGFPNALPPVVQTGFGMMQQLSSSPVSVPSLPIEVEQPPNQFEQIIQPLEENQRPTAFVSRIYNTEVKTVPVPYEVEEYRRLSREERALKQTNPRLLTAMAIRCTVCKKVIKQLKIEEALLSGQTLRQVMDSQDYIRICCRKQIQNEPAVVNIQNQMASQQNTINMMNDLSISSTAASLTGRSTFNTSAFGPVPSQSKIRILNEAPPGMVQESVQLYGPNASTIGISDSFAGASPMQIKDSYTMSVASLNHDNDEY